MTLITGMAFKDQFVLLATDSKVIIEYHDENFDKVAGIVEETDIKHDKVVKLSNYVLMATSGIVETGKALKQQLSHRIRPEHTLEKCAETLQNAVDYLWSKRKEWKEGGDSDRESLSLNFLGTINFGCVMFGFMNNGKTGMVRLNPGTLIVEVIESPMDGGFPCIIISPSLDDNENYLKWLDLRTEDHNFNNFLTQIAAIHGKLSWKHPVSVSPDSNVFVLFRNQTGHIEEAKQIIDTSLFHQAFRENPNWDHQELWTFFQTT